MQMRSFICRNMSLKFPTNDLDLSIWRQCQISCAGPSPHALSRSSVVHAPAPWRELEKKKHVDLVNPSVQVQLTESGMEIAMSPGPRNYCTLLATAMLFINLMSIYIYNNACIWPLLQVVLIMGDYWKCLKPTVCSIIWQKSAHACPMSDINLPDTVYYVPDVSVLMGCSTEHQGKAMIGF